MRTTHQEIVSNSVQDACLSAMPFDLNSAKLLGEALKSNSSIQNLDIGLCNLNDDEFAVIASALIARPKGLSLLNLNYNDMTFKSLESFQNLITNGKVKTITIFKCDDLLENVNFMEKLKECASSHDVIISSQNPSQNKITSKLFPKINVDTKKQDSDLSEHKEQSIEPETKSPPRSPRY